jgi:two-component system chemotaxis response regulator CheV
LALKNLLDGIPVVMHCPVQRPTGRWARACVDACVAKFDAEMLAETLRPLLMKASRE